MLASSSSESSDRILNIPNAHPQPSSWRPSQAGKFGTSDRKISCTWWKKGNSSCAANSTEVSLWQRQNRVVWLLLRRFACRSKCKCINLDGRARLKNLLSLMINSWGNCSSGVCWQAKCGNNKLKSWCFRTLPFMMFLTGFSDCSCLSLLEGWVPSVHLH